MQVRSGNGVAGPPHGELHLLLGRTAHRAPLQVILLHQEAWSNYHHAFGVGVGFGVELGQFWPIWGFMVDA